MSSDSQGSSAGPARHKAQVTVVIPVFNGERFIAGAVASALAQTFPLIEVVVADDGSTDGTLGALKQFGDAITVVTGPNGGVSSARNKGAAAAQGEFLAFLDADDLWEPTKLEHQVGVLERRPDVGLTYCGITEINGAGQPLAVRLDGKGGSLAVELFLFETGLLGGSTALVRRSVFEHVGGFEPSLSTAADLDFALRVAERWPIHYVNEPLVRYRLHGGNMHANLEIARSDNLLVLARALGRRPDLYARHRRRAHARLYMALAGSHLSRRELRSAAACASRAVAYRPAQVLYAFGLPARRRNRRGTPRLAGAS